MIIPANVINILRHLKINMFKGKHVCFEERINE